MKGFLLVIASTAELHLLQPLNSKRKLHSLIRQESEYHEYQEIPPQMKGSKTNQ
ncbi:hypothetical protein ACM26V_03480 [Salipaludibacillus sp. HK11]|uniref:hypothetical protein n=1 Tax=Salipaludibacillus sp. HK11 TaxID=3394320 RepID=UPI0039FCB440